MDLFRDEIGLSTKEVVAVMGAHALGDADPNDSGGFHGPWVPQGRAMILDNAFYVELAAKAWAQDAKAVPGAPAGTVVHQWDASNAPRSRPDHDAQHRCCPLQAGRPRRKRRL